ncbi:hypothetical protein [Congregicoccus parvus]
MRQETAAEAYRAVLATTGATLSRRDAPDALDRGNDTDTTS